MGMLGGVIPPAEQYGTAWAAGIETPLPVPVGAVTKQVFKVGGLGIGLIGGFLAGRLLGGGGQEVSPTQTTEVTPTQLTAAELRARTQQRMRDIRSMMKAAATAKADVDVTITPEITPTYRDIHAGGDIEIGGVSHISYIPTTATADVSQGLIGLLSQQMQLARQEPQQITIVTPEQKVEATQMDMGIIALAIAAVAAIFLLRKKK